MTRGEADVQCAQRNAEVGQDQPGVRWLARQASPGDWQVVRVVIPGARPRNPLRTTTETQPEHQPDPRPQVNPNWGLPF